MRDPRLVLGPALVAALLGCGDKESPSAADAHVVQLVSAVSAPAGVHCDGVTVPSYLFLVNVTMVNTTDVPVNVTSVSTAGVYLNGPTGDLGIVHSSVPFTPLFLRAHDGEGVTTVSVGGTCPGPAGYGEVSVTVYVNTETGNYATKPLKMAFGH